MSAVTQVDDKAVAAEKATPASRFHFGPALGWFLTRATLVLLCVIWTVPVIGLFVTSFREDEAIRTSGWWTALSSSFRTPIDRPQIDGTGRVEVDGDFFVVRGNLFDENEEFDAASISKFGLSRSVGADTAAGATAVNERTGVELTVERSGDYVLRVAREVDEEGNLEPVPEDGPTQSVSIEVEQPPQPTFENYDTVLNGNEEKAIDDRVGQSFLTTLVVTIPATIIPIAIAAIASYAFSWMTFRGRRFFFILVVALLVVPLQLSLIPVQSIYDDLSLTGTYVGIWLAHTGFGLPLAIYLLSNYIGGLPREIIESAQIDGATHFQIFVRLIVPLSVPALASFAIFQFLWVWNDLLVARVFLGRDPDRQVLTSTIKGMTGTFGNNWEIMTAAAFVSMIVPLLVFFALQRYFVRGLMAGSVKGG